MSEQVAVIDSPKPKKLEEVVSFLKNRIVQLAGMDLNKLKDSLMDEPALRSQLDGLTKRVDILVLNFFVDKGSKEPRS